MSRDVIFPEKIKRTNFTFMLHDSEAFFDFQSFLVENNCIARNIYENSCFSVEI